MNKYTCPSCGGTSYSAATPETMTDNRCINPECAYTHDVVRALRSNAGVNTHAAIMLMAADEIEGLQAQLDEYTEKTKHGEYFDAVGLAQIAINTQRYGDALIENGKLRDQLAESQRRADAAVEALDKISGFSGSLTCHCSEMIGIAKAGRGPQEAAGVEQNNLPTAASRKGARDETDYI